jgi:hypothetical protein
MLSTYNRQSFLRLLFATVMALILLFNLAGAALAADIRGGEAIVIGQDEVVNDDVILTGTTVQVDGIINGDLIATGSKVTVNGTVNGSLLFAGQTLVLNGKVSGAVYSAGAALTIGPTAEVERNLFFAGYSAESKPGSLIGRDALMAGYQGIFNGQIGRHLLVALGALELNGQVAGNVLATVDSPGAGPTVMFPVFFGGQEIPATLPAGLRVGPDANIGGTFSYSSPVDQSGTIRALPEGGVVFTLEPGQTDTATVVATPFQSNAFLNWLAVRVRELISLLVIAGLIFWLMPALFAQVSEHAQSETLMAGIWGILVAIIGYAGTIALVFFLIFLVAALATMTLSGLAVTTFGLGFSSLGLAYTLFSILVIYVSKLVVVYPLSRSLLERAVPSWNHYKIVPLSVGALIFVLLHSIPWLGPLFSIVVTVIGLGAIWLGVHGRFTKAAPQLVLAPA